jgi:hypothetical protein
MTTWTTNIVILMTLEVNRRLRLIGGADAILFDMGHGLTRIALGKAADTILHFRTLTPHEVMQWRDLNLVPLQEFWARAKADALGVKAEIEKIEKQAAK